MKLNVVELFAGVGGFRLGLEGFNGKSCTSGYKKKLDNPIPFKVVYSNQYEPSTKRQHANEIYEQRFGSAGHFGESIEELTVKDIQEHLRVNNIAGNIDVLVGGFPCQDYSVATTLRNSKGLKGNKGILWFQIERLLSEFESKPKFLILENVDRLLKSPAKQRGRDFAVMLKHLEALGYVVEWKVINSAEWGFPQRRKRVFILAYLAESVSKKYLGLLDIAFPALQNTELASFDLLGDEAELSKTFGVDKKVSDFKVDGHMINGNVVTQKAQYLDTKGKVLGDVIERDIKMVPKEFILSAEENKLFEALKGGGTKIRTTSAGHSYKYSEGSMSYPDGLEKPSRTIITGEGGKTPSRFKHVIQHGNIRRRLMPVELERLNGFPDGWTEGDSITHTKRAFFMGNALVIGVVEMIGATISTWLHEHSKSD